MSKPERVPLRLPLVVIVPIIIACLALVVGTISLVVPFSVASQAYLIIIILLGFRYWPPMVRWVTRMPVAHRVAFGLMIGGMIAGHFTLSSRKYFPFTAWEIFGFEREEDPVSCRELIATTASGKQVRLLVEQLIPSIVQFNLPQNNQSETMDRLVQALAKIYDEHHATDPVQGVNLIVMSVKLHPPASELRTQPTCELLKHYDFSSGRSN